MSLKKTKLLDVVSVTGVSTVGILTVGVTETAGGVGIASTTYVRSILMHNTGLSTTRASLYLYPDGTSQPGYAHTNYRVLSLDLTSNETTFFEMNYPFVLSNGDSLIVEVSAPGATAGGTGIGSMVNFLVNGDTDI